MPVFASHRLLAMVCAIAIGALLTIAPAAAQDQAPAEFPTVLALENVEIPPRDRVVLAQELLGVGEIPPPPTSAPTRQIGDQATYRVSDSSSDRAFNVQATLRAMGEHIYLYVENGADIDTDDLKALAVAFDTRIYDEVRALWGSEDIPGIDGDPRVYGLFAHGLGAGTAAYFVSEHTYPVEAVPTSNEHEMFFFNLDALGYGFDLRSMESIVAHEFQHMIRNRIQVNEETWMNEGLSEFTEFYLYDVPAWVIINFLNDTDTQLNSWAEESSMRSQNYGAAALFLIYFYDRYGLDALRQVSDNPSTRGLDAVDAVLRSMGEPGVNELFADWVVANYLFNPALADGRYGYRSLRSGVVSAQPVDTITEYPLVVESEVNQYATDYYVLTNLDGASTLKVRLDAPSTVPLVPADAYSGQHMWYSNRADMSSTTLTRSFDLSDVDSATLTYQLWYHTESMWDYGYVMVSDDGGETWDILSTDETTEANPYDLAYGPGYTGESGGWVTETISLDDYTGGEVLIRFQMITDDAVTQPGLAIDDVAIDEIGYFEDFEGGEGGWDAEGWVWIDNILPQQVWVQAIQQTGNDATVTRWSGPSATSWALPLEPDVDQVVLAITPYAPVTTVPMPYELQVSVG